MKAIDKLPPRWLSTIADLLDAVMLHGLSGELPGANDIIEGVRHADVLISRAVQPVTRKLMMVNPNLRGISNYGVGYNNIDLTAATELKIPVTNTPCVLTETMADLAWALLMATARKVPQGHDYVLSGQCQMAGKSFMGVDIGPGGFNRSKVLGIIDLGGIGQAVMRRSRGFGVVDRFRRVLFTAVTMREVTKGMTKNLKP